MRLASLAVALLALTAPLRAAPPTGAPSPATFWERGPYRTGIPRPDRLLGYALGAQHTPFRDQERVLDAIAASAPERIRLVPYGRSVEGRPLRIAIIGSPAQIARLDRIRADLDRLADPRSLSDADAKAILARVPVCVWINHCIHGDESASFEAAMATVYTLVASDRAEIAQTLDKTLVIVNPVYNPDGHERFTVWFNSVARGSAERFSYEHDQPWATRGRFNHYRIDMNRDKLAQSQPETRAESAIQLLWHPQVYADLHGQVENYFFPPNAPAIHDAVGTARIEKWTDLFGRGNAEAFDRHGWSYVNREVFDLFAPFYLDSFATLGGAIGMTYETDGGGNLARRRDDGTQVTLADAAAHHTEAALATIRTAAKHRDALLSEYLAFRRAACSVTGRLIVPPTPDRARRARFAAALLHAGIEVGETTAPVTAEKARRYGEKESRKQTFPAGSLVVEWGQPQGAAARAFLEQDPHFDPAFVAAQIEKRRRNEKRGENEPKEEYEFYDATAWSLPLAYNQTAWEVDGGSAPPVRRLSLTTDGGVPALTGPVGGIEGAAGIAYLFRYDSDGAAALALRLVQEGYQLTVATRPVQVGGERWGRGTIVIRPARNPQTLAARLATLAKELQVPVRSLTSTYGDAQTAGLGSADVTTLYAPRIALAMGDGVSHTSLGALWWWLEREVGAQFTLVAPERLRGKTLDRFNAIVLPDGWGYGGAWGKDGVEALKGWMRRGGTLIGLGGGATWLMTKDYGLTDSRRVGDGDPDKEGKKPEKPTDLPGAIFRARLDPEHFLGFGADETEIAVPVSGSSFWKLSTKGANPIQFAKEGPLTLSGFVWPDNTEKLLAGTAFAIDEPVGNGHLILFAHDPMPRPAWQGLSRVLLSALLFGPQTDP
jgi:hypothetical protein